MLLTFLGCRGSTPVSGPHVLRYGGATSCVAVTPDGADAPTMLLDAGTGVMRLGHLLGDRPFTGTILLTHLHWDHTHGLPFARNLGMPGARVDLMVPGQGDDPERVLDRAFSPPHFPVTIRQLGEAWTVSALEPGRHHFEGISVIADEIPHKGGRTFGYRLEHAGRSVAYLPDHRPLGFGPGSEGLGAYHRAALELARGVDLLVHDAQHTAAELPAKAYLGHSAVEYAVGLGAEAGAAAVALFHHDPARTDDELDSILASLGPSSIPVFAAAEGSTVTVGAPVKTALPARP